MAWTPAPSSARRFHSPESSPKYSNIHSWVPSGLVTKPSRDMTILRITFLSLMATETIRPREVVLRLYGTWADGSGQGETAHRGRTPVSCRSCSLSEHD